jgi:hypothetical protein
MSGIKHRLHNTQRDNLISNLRGEIGEIITTWVLLRDLMSESSRLRSDDIAKDLENPQIKILNSLMDKLEDEIIAGLSELGQKKIGRLNFNFVKEKIGAFEIDVEGFHRFIKKNRFHEKRNYDISHKELPEKWTEHKMIHVPYKTIVKGIVLALRLMKKIDSNELGPSAKYLGWEMRKRRYNPMYPAKVGYMVLPYMNLSKEHRKKIIIEEMEAGNIIWESMKAKVQGEEKTVIVCKKWGAILMEPGRALVLDDYPLLELKALDFGYVENASYPTKPTEPPYSNPNTNDP